MSVEELPAQADRGPGIRVLTAGGEDIFRWSEDGRRCGFARTVEGRTTLVRSFDLSE
jgi:hypothetical protein